MNKKTQLCFVSLVIFLFSCSNEPRKTHETAAFAPQSILDSNYHKKNFDSLFAIVCKDTSGLDFSEELLTSSSFRVVYEHSSAYLEDAIRLLSKGEFNTMQASSCIFAMQNLSVVDYVVF